MMFIARVVIFIACIEMLFASQSIGRADETIAGPGYSKFSLTLSSGHREEITGPLFYSQQAEGQHQWAFPPFVCYTRNFDVDWVELDILYPVLTYRRFGSEYRGQFFQCFSYSGGQTQEEYGQKKTTIFPFYFQQRSTNTADNYTALMPFYGHVVNRMMRDDIRVVLFPIFSETRKKDIVTDNYLYPFFHLRHGDGLNGWQFWPVIGMEHKTPTSRTNTLDEVEIIGGHEHFFAVWPFFLKGREGIGTTNEEHRLTLFPFYNRLRSPLRDETSWGCPFRCGRIDDRENKYVENDYIWPLFVRARGSKTVTRIFPFYSRADNGTLESDFYLWPVYKFNRLQAPLLDRQRMRIFMFLYSDTVQKSIETGKSTRRADFWPFYTFRHEMDGNEQLQALSLLQPFFPNNRTISREYDQVYSLWRWEKNAKTGAASESFLWNLYRRETAPKLKKISLLFGLIQYESTAGVKNWRVCYVHLNKARPVATPF